MKFPTEMEDYEKLYAKWSEMFHSGWELTDGRILQGMRERMVEFTPNSE